MAAGRRIGTDALTPVPLRPLLNLHQRIAASCAEEPGFLDGTAGADLIAAGITTSWDACLLLC